MVGQPLEAHIRRLQEFYWSEHDPDGRGFVPLADALRKAGDFVESHRVLREGLGRHPELVSGHVVAGWLSLDRGRPEEAEAEFRTALELDSKNIAALRALGDILLERGDGAAAIEVLEELSHEDPIDLNLPHQIAELRLEAESGQEMNPDQDGEPPSPVWDDPYAVADELDWDSATLQPDESPQDEPAEEAGEELREESIEPEPQTPEDSAPLVEDGEPLPGDEGLQGAMITSTLGEIYLRQGLFDQAEDVFETLLKADPNSVHLQGRLEEVRGLKSGGGALGERESFLPPEEDDWPETGTALDPASGEGLLQAEPIAPGVVPIESLAPDRIATRSTEDPPQWEASVPDEPISIDALAPDEAVAIDALAPDEPISIDALAPDEAVAIDALAPDEPISIDALAPDEAVAIEALAPNEPISIDALAPDDSQGDPSLGTFERWLDDLK